MRPISHSQARPCSRCNHCYVTDATLLCMYGDQFEHDNWKVISIYGNPVSESDYDTRLVYEDDTCDKWRPADYSVKQ